jgi:peroxiredoxin
MKKLILIAMAALALTACEEQKPSFTIEGTVKGAKDQTLFLYNNALGGAVKLDSVKLTEEGTFTLHGEAPQSPELYSLIVGNQMVYFGIDSTETVTINADYATMSSAYEVEGSVSSEKIKQLTLRQHDLQRQIMAIQNNLDLSRQQIVDSLQHIVDNYKNDITMEFIYENPGSIYAYYALFQTLGGWNVFDRSNPQDVRAFAAVATSWDTFYPESDRAKHLHNTTIKGMNDTRQAAAREMMAAETAGQIETVDLLDLSLPDASGHNRTLTELKGKVVMLDFHMFNMKESAARILSLRELYNKYHSQGLEIYQVGLDENEHFWKQQTESLPWICVYDPSALSARNYNVQSIPEYFLIDRNNALYKRSSQMSDVEQEIRTLLANPTNSAK